MSKEICTHCGELLSFCDGVCLYPRTERFEKDAWEPLVAAIRGRHNNPDLNAALGIDPDEPEELAAIALLAVRELIEELVGEHKATGAAVLEAIDRHHIEGSVFAHHITDALGTSGPTL